MYVLIILVIIVSIEVLGIIFVIRSVKIGSSVIILRWNLSEGDIRLSFEVFK